MKMVRGLQNKLYKERFEDLVMFSLEERRLKGSVTILFKYWKTVIQKWQRLFSTASDSKTQPKGLMLLAGKLQLKPLNGESSLTMEPVTEMWEWVGLCFASADLQAEAEKPSVGDVLVLDFLHQTGGRIRWSKRPFRTLRFSHVVLPSLLLILSFTTLRFLQRPLESLAWLSSRIGWLWQQSFDFTWFPDIEVINASMNCTAQCSSLFSCILSDSTMFSATCSICTEASPSMLSGTSFCLKAAHSGYFTPQNSALNSKVTLEFNVMKHFSHGYTSSCLAFINYIVASKFFLSMLEFHS